MAIEHADSFDIYGPGEGGPSFMLDGVYAQVSPNFGGGIKDDPDGISTQRCLGLNAGVWRYALQTPVSVLGVAKRIWMPSLPAGGDQECVPFMFSNIDNVTLGSVAVQSNGAMSVRLGNSGAASYSTNVPVVTAEAWWHLEVRVDFDAGELELRVEGRTVMHRTGLVFPEEMAYQVLSAAENDGAGHQTAFYEKDLVIWNTLGTDNVDFLGPVRVINCTPIGDVALGGWQPVGDTQGFPILSNNPPVSSEYLSADPADVGAFMEFDLSNIPDDITTVKAAITFVRARKIDGGFGQLQTSMIGTDGDASPGADRAITAGDIYWRDVHERDPGTDTAWTRIAINAAKIKINRTL